MDASSKTMFEMRSVRKRFGATEALGGVDFTLATGQVHALIGENGAGKSTLMKVLSGALRPDSGEMVLDGKPYRPSSPMDARGQGIAMIYQELALAPHLTVQENVMLGVEQSTFGFLRRKVMRQQVQKALDFFEHPEIKPETKVGSLSTGAQQVVEIARALIMQCRILVFDEPTSSLAQADVGRLFGLIDRLRKRDIAIVYISHFLEEIKRIADRFTVLREGKSVGGGPVEGTAAEEMVSMMVGRKMEGLFPRSVRKPGEVLLRIDDLGGQRKPMGASLELRKGEVLGVAGLVGAGRTELLQCLFGLAPIKKGEITWRVYVGPASPARRLSQGMGLLSEDRKGEGLAAQMSIADNLTLSRLRPFGSFGWLSSARQRDRTRSFIEKLGIRCRDERQRVAELSGGNQQKVALARLLHHEVDLLLLDEPTRGIDIGSKAQIYQLIDELVVRGRSILLVSSYLPELFGVCDRIAVMNRGRLGPARPVGEWTEHEVMVAATGGTAE